MQGFPSSGPQVATALGFQGSIVAILGLYVVFWLKLDLITLLPILALLLLLASAFGYNALRSHGAGHVKLQ